MKITHVRKAILYGTGLLPIMFIMLISCDSTEYPEPEENPVYVTSDAQTKDTWIKNLRGIAPENPETDIVEINNIQTATQNTSIKIKNAWITLDRGGNLPKDVVRITVTENTSPNPRCYVLTIHSKIQHSEMTIVQMGETNE